MYVYIELPIRWEVSVQSEMAEMLHPNSRARNHHGSARHIGYQLADDVLLPII